MTEENTMQEFGTQTGRVLRFFNRKGYGFIQDLFNNESYFVHNTGIRVTDDIYRKLYPGEYVSYNLVERDGKRVCSDVRGIMGFPLLVENEDHTFRVYPKESRRDYGYNEKSVVYPDTDSGSDDVPNDDVPNDDVPNDDVPNDDVPNDDVSNDDVPNDDVSNDDVPNEVINKEAPDGLEVAEFDGLNINEEMS
jgi:cold shock CspA family protein